MVHTHNNHIVTCMSTDLLLLDIDCVSDRGASQIERKLHARRTRGKTHSCYMLTVCRSIGNWHVEIMWISLAHIRIRISIIHSRGNAQGR